MTHYQQGEINVLSFESYKLNKEILNFRQIKSKKSEHLERSLKIDHESSTIEDYVYKLPPPKSRPENDTDAVQRIPLNLPKDVVTKMDIKNVSILL